MLSFEDLMAEVEAETQEKGLKFKAKDGKTVLLKPVALLGRAELLNVMAMLPQLASDDVSSETKIDLAAQILVCVADKKASLQKSLDELPPLKNLTIVEQWMEAQGDELPES